MKQERVAGGCWKQADNDEQLVGAAGQVEQPI